MRLKRRAILGEKREELDTVQTLHREGDLVGCAHGVALATFRFWGAA